MEFLTVRNKGNKGNKGDATLLFSPILLNHYIAYNTTLKLQKHL